jgi:hypothetical protein
MCNFFLFFCFWPIEKKKKKISRNGRVKITHCDGCQAIVTLDERLNLSISFERKRKKKFVLSGRNSWPINRQLHCSLQILVASRALSFSFVCVLANENDDTISFVCFPLRMDEWMDGWMRKGKKDTVFVCIHLEAIE